MNPKKTHAIVSTQFTTIMFHYYDIEPVIDYVCEKYNLHYVDYNKNNCEAIVTFRGFDVAINMVEICYVVYITPVNKQYAYKNRVMLENIKLIFDRFINTNGDTLACEYPMFDNESYIQYAERLQLIQQLIQSRKRIQERSQAIHEELVATVWHPTRVEW